MSKFNFKKLQESYNASFSFQRIVGYSIALMWVGVFLIILHWKVLNNPISISALVMIGLVVVGFFIYDIYSIIKEYKKL